MRWVPTPRASPSLGRTPDSALPLGPLGPSWRKQWLFFTLNSSKTENFLGPNVEYFYFAESVDAMLWCRAMNQIATANRGPPTARGHHRHTIGDGINMGFRPRSHALSCSDARATPPPRQYERTALLTPEGLLRQAASATEPRGCPPPPPEACIRRDEGAGGGGGGPEPKKLCTKNGLNQLLFFFNS